MTFLDIQGKKFEPVGRCIYCGGDGGKAGLRIEHIMPLSLGGKAELPEASCRGCEKITSYLDGYLARHVFYQHRHHSGGPSRRRRPHKLPAKFIIDGEEIELDLPIEDHPFCLAVPIWGLPGVLLGAPPSESFPPAKMCVFTYAPENLHNILNVPSAASVQVDNGGTINLPTFARALAKIAYCHTVAYFGIDGFNPLETPNLVRGLYPCPSYFVGNEAGEPPAPHPDRPLHLIQIGEAMVNDIPLILVSLRLFAGSGTKTKGMPWYTIITGVRTNG